MSHRFRPLALILLLLTSTGVRAAESGNPGPDAHAGTVSLAFASQGSLLARRGHQTLTVATVDVDSADVSIAHVDEADVLKVLEAGPRAPLPASAQTVLRQDIAATDGAGGPAKPGMPGTVSIDILHLLPSLQPGLYFVTARPKPFGAAAGQWLMISNLGIEAFSGADSIVAQIRLLSETTAAPGVEVALISRNNRELGRLRTDAEGVARFTADAIGGKGDDAPAALYAYGADGEFTALRLDKPGLVFPGVPADNPPPYPRAWIVTDRPDYKPGDTIKGLVIVRDAAGRQPAKPQSAQLVGADGHIFQEVPVNARASGLASFEMHAPALHDATPTLRITGATRVLAGGATIGIDAHSAPPETPAAAQTADYSGALVISPGRRTFQPGEPANISVQPPVDADVTLAVIDDRVHAVIRQHIGKEGGVVQLPIPPDALGGVYVLATAFTPADEASGKPVQRLFGLQWLDVDEGAKRMGVRLDAPETATAGRNAAVQVTLPDLGSDPGSFAIVGTDASVPSGIDPIRYFFGHHLASVELHDDYADVIGGGAQPAMPDIASLVAVPAMAGQPALLWNAPETGNAAPVSVTLALPDTGKDRSVRLSVIAASDDKIGFSETGITVKGHKAGKADARPPTVAKAHAVVIKPGGTLTLKPGQAAIVTAMPVVAPPAWVSATGETGAALPSTDTWIVQSDFDEKDADTLIYDQIVASAVGLQPADDRLQKRIEDMIEARDLSPDQTYLAVYGVYRGNPVPLPIRDWLDSAPKPTTRLAWLCRYALTHAEADATALAGPERDDDTAGKMPLRQRILQILVAQQIGRVALKANSATGIAELAKSAQDFASLDPRDRLGLRAIEQAAAAGRPVLPEWATAPKMEGLAASGLVRAGTRPLTLTSKDARALHALVLSDWPDTAPQ